MKLEEAQEHNHLHPPAEHREQILAEQIATFRQEFYRNMMSLKRIAAWEAANEPLKSEGELVEIVRMLTDGGEIGPERTNAEEQLNLAREKARLERNLDTIKISIETTRGEHKSLNPDA